MKYSSTMNGMKRDESPASECSYAAMDEAKLLHAARTNPEAFGELYQRYLTRIYRYVRVRTSSDEEAADLTQDIFVKAMDALPRYRERGLPFAAWLFRIARNSVIDAHRRHRTTVNWDRLPEALQQTDEGNPETIVLHEERLAHLTNLIGQLDPEKQELLALRFAAGLTAREIASVVNKSETAVKKQFSRILQSLKEQGCDE